MNLPFPKPKAQKKATPALRIVVDGNGEVIREVCNVGVRAGRSLYRERIRQMWERQRGRCCLYGLVPGCPGHLAIEEATFDHDEGRGQGGGHRDDRIEIVWPGNLVLWINGAAHAWCNVRKGSARKSTLLAKYYNVS